MTSRAWLAALCMLAAPVLLHAQDAEHRQHAPMMHADMVNADMVHTDMMHTADTTDARTPLGLTPMQRQHQLANMRSHLQAVQDIVGMIAENRFDEASGIAHDKLGLTPEMQKMCSMFADADFREIGLAFHRSADRLGETLKLGNTAESLQALHTTMNYCVQCHATYRQ